MPLRDLPRAVPLAGPLAVFLAGGLLGLAVSYDLRLSVPWLMWLGTGAALYVALVLLARTPGRLRLAAALPALAAAAAGLCLAVQYRHLAFEAKIEPVARLGTLISAPFPRLGIGDVEPNAASTFLEGGLPIAVGLALAARGWRRWAWGVSATLIGLGVLLTVSRGAWVALAAGALAWGLLEWRWGRASSGPRAVDRGSWTRDRGTRPKLVGPRSAVRSLRPVLVLSSLAIVAGALAAAPTLDSATFRVSDRLALYRNSLFLALEFPLSGIGPGGTFAMMYSHFQLLIIVPYLGYAHNLLLGAWLAQGLLGLAGLLALILAAGRLIGRGLRVPGEDGCAQLRAGAAVGALVLLLHGTIDAPQYDLNRAHLLPMCFAVLALAVAGARLTDERRATNDGRRATGDGRRATGDGAATDVTNGLVTAPRPPVFGRRSPVLLLALAVIAAALAGPQLLALGAANVSAVLHAHARLTPEVGPTARNALMGESLMWAERALAFDARSPAALKRRGMLALAQDDYGTAVVALERARHSLPEDQAVRKALGLAYIWYGLVDEGTPLLAALDDPREMREELEVWSAAWEDRRRPDLAERARLAAKRIED